MAGLLSSMAVRAAFGTGAVVAAKTGWDHLDGSTIRDPLSTSPTTNTGGMTGGGDASSSDVSSSSTTGSGSSTLQAKRGLMWSLGTPDYNEPTKRPAWMEESSFEGVRARADKDDSLKPTEGLTLAESVSSGSSGYTLSNLLGPSYKTSGNAFQAQLLAAQGLLRTQGSVTTATGSLYSASGDGDKGTFEATLGSLAVERHGQHSRQKFQAMGPFLGLNMGYDPSAEVGTGKASMSTSVAAHGDRWGLSMGGEAAYQGPGIKVDKTGLELREKPSTSLKGGLSLTRLRNPEDPTSSEQVVSLEKERGALPKVSVNPDAVYNIGRDNADAAAQFHADSMNETLNPSLDERTFMKPPEWL